MIEANPQAARMLQSLAPEISEVACTHLFSRVPDIGELFGSDYSKLWADHFQQRLTELSTAIAAGQPELFVGRVAWTRGAMEARGQSGRLIDTSLASLRQALIEVLNDNVCPEAISLVEQAAVELAQAPCVLEESALDARRPLDRISLRFLQASMEGNVRVAIQIILDSLEEGVSAQDLMLRVLMPAQAEVGRLWHRAEISIAEEHIVTATTERAMALIAQRAPCARDNGYSAVCAAVSGNVHDVGIHAISYLLELNGWRAVYLGHDMPRHDLPAAVEFYDADVVLLSLALSAQLSNLQSAVAEIRKHCPKVQIMVGGNAFAASSGLWKKTGADGFAPNGEQAVVLANELVQPVTYSLN